MSVVQQLVHNMVVGCVLLLLSQVSTAGLSTPQNLLLFQVFVPLVKQGSSVGTQLMVSCTPANTLGVNLAAATDFPLKLVVNRGLMYSMCDSSLCLPHRLSPPSGRLFCSLAVTLGAFLNCGTVLYPCRAQSASGYQVVLQFVD